MLTVGKMLTKESKRDAIRDSDTLGWDLADSSVPTSDIVHRAFGLSTCYCGVQGMNEAEWIGYPTRLTLSLWPCRRRLQRPPTVR